MGNGPARSQAAGARAHVSLHGPGLRVPRPATGPADLAAPTGGPMTREPNTPRTTTTTAPRSQDVPQRSASIVFAVLVGLAALAVLLQGLWAGIFLQHDG